jgi:cysteine-rich repeat protein
MVRASMLGAIAAIAGCGFDQGSPTHCGDGVLDEHETCDDGGRTSGDGCDTTCLIEPDYACPNVGSFCLPVVGLLATPGSALAPVGGNGGTPFMQPCAVGEQLVGLETSHSNDTNYVARTRGLCARVGFRSDGRVIWTTTNPTNFEGNEQNNSTIVACADDEVAVGYAGATATNFVSAFQLICQPIGFADGALGFGPARMLPAFASMIGVVQPAAQCPSGQVAREYDGRSGAIIDQLSMQCGAVSAVVCGDGVKTAPETCDDGNVTAGDGCGPRCQTE